jgi:DMSO/TMAO reductase YedYZ molybdopterin-dependent catalytic subunit
MRGLFVIAGLCAGLTASLPLQADEPAASPKVLEVVDAAGKTHVFTAADLAKLPQTEVKAKDSRGDALTWLGVTAAAVLKQADVDLAEKLKGKRLTDALIVEATDKYRVLFSLPEVDPDWTDKVVLLATSREGQQLDAAHGPLQLVVPGDKRHSRWVKQVVRLTIQTEAR